jgi:hypothetical protein
MATPRRCDPTPKAKIVEPIIIASHRGQENFVRLPPVIPAAKLRFYPDEISDNPKSPSLDDLLGVEQEVIGGRPHMKVASFGGEIGDRKALKFVGRYTQIGQQGV